MSRRLRVAIVTESFLPQVNGVTNSVRHVVDHLVADGHTPLVIAPAPGLADYRGVPVVRTRSIAPPMYKSFPIGLPDQAVEKALAAFRPDVVHLASPISLGAAGLRAARRLGLPTVAVYQTDIPGFLRQYGLPGEASVARWVARIHRRADRTLVPSTAAHRKLESLGVPNLHRWGRGVDLDLFGPSHRLAHLHDRWARAGRGRDPHVVVGYVGRLAPEKQVRRLREIADLPGVRVVVVGDGPEKEWLRKNLPGAVFTGMLSGLDLARAYASLDAFVHTGERETFCQTIQEAQASGVPVVAPAAGGPIDLVDHGRTGLLYDPDEPASLRSTVALLARDQELRGELAAAGLRRVASLDWRHVVQDLVERHYREVLGLAAEPDAA
ncbi:glycosyltransferase family 4 protein [Nocardioides pocheonensis]|uniref:Glycosyltransferase family 1 protein n=1 Tax=Nocardioides pocheonensis TaxID=661485 RepID=A0A3N0GUK6_9ACTN|nr:glycosyltransferase family 1 protein [Nocardioides pocheonensis]RNM15790.1 glycosyltransferase family 1 protein [Nocardioides pocheonensis]